MEDQGTLLGTIEIRDGVELRVSIQKFKNRRYLSARIWEKYQATGELGPTKRGFNILADLAPELAELIAKAG